MWCRPPWPETGLSPAESVLPDLLVRLDACHGPAPYGSREALSCVMTTLPTFVTILHVPVCLMDALQRVGAVDDGPNRSALSR